MGSILDESDHPYKGLEWRGFPSEGSRVISFEKLRRQKDVMNFTPYASHEIQYTSFNQVLYAGYDEESRRG
ncbi:alpha amylase C-terminal domain-containing protein [Halobacillus sp. A5]|uniref:alpha amylase C-terminal domain-containing protein n=1 Tax=Halobacillus sp. A5 TaxID=2880263 RepID=UPI0020A6CE9A|nr:alpha amylase C-terminal domain-containing protein [Halobacillus sp. A5]MCP3026586.1 alpha amylase C-terminal domain-containing protein [Halobacillus sp. A5]